MAKKLVKEICFPPLPTIVKPNGNEPLPNEDDKMLAYNFDYGSKNDFNIICNIIYALPFEFDSTTEMT